MAFIKYLDPRNDYAFKRIFGNENNKDILIRFLNDMVEFKNHRVIREVTFLKTIQEPEIASKKQSILDILCADEYGDQYIVEMQVAKIKGFDKRAQYYAAKAYANQLVKGDNYPALKEIVFLAITDFVMFKNKAAYKSDHVLLDKQTHEHDLKDFSFTFLELPKFNKSLDQLETMVEKWTYFLKHADQTTELDAEKLMGEDVVLKRAYQALNKCAMSDIELRTYEQEEKRDRDARGIEDAKIEDAKEEGITETAINLLMEGLQEDLVSRVTGLSLEKIMALRKNVRMNSSPNSIPSTEEV